MLVPMQRSRWKKVHADSSADVETASKLLVLVIQGRQQAASHRAALIAAATSREQKLSTIQVWPPEWLGVKSC